MCKSMQREASTRAPVWLAEDCSVSLIVTTDPVTSYTLAMNRIGELGTLIVPAPFMVDLPRKNLWPGQTSHPSGRAAF